MATEDPNDTDFTEADVFFMQKALHVAEAALGVGEVPVGCVLVLPTDRGDVIVSHGANRVNATRDGKWFGSSLSRILVNIKGY